MHLSVSFNVGIVIILLTFEICACVEYRSFSHQFPLLVPFSPPVPILCIYF